MGNNQYLFFTIMIVFLIIVSSCGCFENDEGKGKTEDEMSFTNLYRQWDFETYGFKSFDIGDKFRISDTIKKIENSTEYIIRQSHLEKDKNWTGKVKYQDKEYIIFHALTFDVHIDNSNELSFFLITDSGDFQMFFDKYKVNDSITFNCVIRKSIYGVESEEFEGEIDDLPVYKISSLITFSG